MITRIEIKDELGKMTTDGIVVCPDELKFIRASFAHSYEEARKYVSRYHDVDEIRKDVFRTAWKKDPTQAGCNYTIRTITLAEVDTIEITL